MKTVDKEKTMTYN